MHAGVLPLAPQLLLHLRAPHALSVPRRSATSSCRARPREASRSARCWRDCSARWRVPRTGMGLAAWRCHGHCARRACCRPWTACWHGDLRSRACSLRAVPPAAASSPADPVDKAASSPAPLLARHHGAGVAAQAALPPAAAGQRGARPPGRALQGEDQRLSGRAWRQKNRKLNEAELVANHRAIEQARAGARPRRAPHPERTALPMP
jgi:hypothetical protein